MPDKETTQVTKSIRGIDPELYKRAKAKAALSGQSIGELINDALKEYLNKKEETK